MGQYTHRVLQQLSHLRGIFVQGRLNASEPSCALGKRADALLNFFLR